MDLTIWKNRILNHTINKNKTKEIVKLKKVFQSRTKWSLMKKHQRILLLCWKLTINGMFEINKKQIAEICGCNEKYVNHVFQNNPNIHLKNNLVYNNFETILKKREEKEFRLAFSKRFFISRKPNFNGIDVYLELKKILTNILFVSI